MNKNQKGFIAPLIAIIVAVLAVGGGVSYYLKTKHETSSVVNNEVATSTTEKEDSTKTVAPPVPTPTPTPVVTPNQRVTPPTSGQVNPPSNKTDGIIGILNVVTNCGIPEGCGPKYSLSSDSEFKSATPLVSDNIIKDSDSGLIVRISGSEVPYKCTDVSCSDNSPTKAIKVSTYSTLSKIPWHDFLVKKAFEYTIQKYPCLAVKEYGGTTYNKTFSWEFTNNTPMIKVRMTDTLSGAKPQAFYELWYNGNSGSLIKETSYPEDKVFCQ